MVSIYKFLSNVLSLEYVLSLGEKIRREFSREILSRGGIRLQDKFFEEPFEAPSKTEPATT